MGKWQGTIFCEITPPGNQYSPGVYAFSHYNTYTMSHFYDMSRYVWIDDAQGPRWLKNPDRDISGKSSTLNEDECKYFFFAKIRAQYM